jgi:hypothetical protein
VGALQEAATAREEAAAAAAAARKLETDLEDLSSAYSTLDSFSNRVQEELEAARAAGEGRPAGDAEVTARIEEALRGARQEAEVETAAALDDLLVCLGQEEAKVWGATRRGKFLGVDCSIVLVLVTLGFEGQHCLKVD